MTLRRMISSSFVCLWIVGCGSDLNRNSDFDRWCGDDPCEWKVEGDVHRVGTWHTNDYAVELSDGAQLSQVNATVDQHITCLEFSLVAKIDRGAQVFLELDFLNDGTIDFSQQLPTSDWERLTFKITPPDWYKGLRFIVRKQGSGRAIVAELGAEYDYSTCSAPPVVLPARPSGAGCKSDEQCDGTQCVRGVCSGCMNDSTCEADELCGLSWISATETRSCMPLGLGQFGTPCLDGRQCESGFCVNRACSECEEDSCEDGSRCAPAESDRRHNRFWPNVCDPGSSARSEGELCTSNSDCQSRRCGGIKYSCVPLNVCTGGTCGATGCNENMTSGGRCE